MSQQTPPSRPASRPAPDAAPNAASADAAGTTDDAIERRRSQEQRREESAARLRRALAELICEQGYSATTNAQIGERAGFSRNMVRDRFGTKDALLMDLIERAGREQAGEPDVPALSSGLERVRRRLGMIRRFAEEEPIAMRAICVVLFEGAARAHPLASAAHARLAAVSERIAVAVADGVADGSIRADLDVEQELALLRVRTMGFAFEDAGNLGTRPVAERRAEVHAAFEARLARTGVE